MDAEFISTSNIRDVSSFGTRKIRGVINIRNALMVAPGTDGALLAAAETAADRCSIDARRRCLAANIARHATARGQISALFPLLDRLSDRRLRTLKKAHKPKGPAPVRKMVD